MFGYALRQINPTDKDYGQQLNAASVIIVDHTIDDFYFWSNCVSLTLLTGVTGVCFLQLRVSDKKERIASALIAQLWNGRVSDKIEIERRTAEHNLLVDKHNQVVEQSFAATPGGRKRKEAREDTLHEMPRIEIVEAKPAAPILVVVPKAVVTPAPENVVAVVEPEPKPDSLQENSGQGMKTLVPALPPSVPSTPEQIKQDFAREQEIRKLTSQVDAYRNTERNLKERLNSLQAYVDQTKDLQSSGAKRP